MIAYTSTAMTWDEENSIYVPLVSALKEKGFVIDNRYTLNAEEHEIPKSIVLATLFVGIVSNNAPKDQLDMVSQEWAYAKKNSVPAILLVEGKVYTLNPQLHDDNSAVAFDRYNISYAKQQIEEHYRNSIAKLAQNGTAKTTNPKRDNTLAWVLGGAVALGMLGVFASAKE